MKKILAVILAVMVLGMVSTVDVSAKKRPKAKARTTKVKKSTKSKGRICPKCHGTGIYVPYYEVAYGCPNCGGRGSAETNRMGVIRVDKGLVKGRGRI